MGRDISQLKVEIVVNRHVAAQNRKRRKEEGSTAEEKPCIRVKTSRGTLYCKALQITGTVTILQDGDHPRSCGATIWGETTLGDITLDGVAGTEAFGKLSPKGKKKQSTQQQIELR